jgi:hypothetical protein
MPIDQGRLHPTRPRGTTVSLPCASIGYGFLAEKVTRLAVNLARFHDNLGAPVSLARMHAGSMEVFRIDRIEKTHRKRIPGGARFRAPHQYSCRRRRPCGTPGSAIEPLFG